MALQATLTVLLLPLVASQLASFEQLRRAWLGLVTNNNPCKKSLFCITDLWELRQQNWIIFFPPPAHQVREHPSHHRGTGWEQG